MGNFEQKKREGAIHILCGVKEAVKKPFKGEI